MNDVSPAMLSALNDANSILLCTHISPDGDAAGSLLAMGEALRGMGKDVTMACADPVPRQYQFLEGADAVVHAAALEGRTFDAALALDAAAPSRLGDCQAAFFAAPVTMQMDHHPDNPLYARYNAVDGEASAAGCVVWRALKAMRAPITPQIAAALYCAVSTDTGNFRFSSTTPEAFRMMAELMEAGLDLPAVARPVHVLREEPQLRLLGRALNSLRVFCGGKCACVTLRQADYTDAQARPEHNIGIVNYALDMPGVEMAFLAEEQPDGRIKASLRAQPPWVVADIARKFDGGGHALAAAFRCAGTLESVCAAIENEMARMIGDRP